jgi:hypothetical protein
MECLLPEVLLEDLDSPIHTGKRRVRSGNLAWVGRQMWTASKPTHLALLAHLGASRALEARAALELPADARIAAGEGDRGGDGIGLLSEANLLAAGTYKRWPQVVLI